MKFRWVKCNIGQEQRKARRDLVREIQKHYPPEEYPRVADVAGGNGQLTQLLLKAGYKVTLIDPSSKKVKGARFWKRKFLVRDRKDFDLIIGYRPCGASQKMVRAAKYMPVVLVLCGCRSIWPGCCGKWPTTLARDFMRKHRILYRKHGYWYFMHGRRE